MTSLPRLGTTPVPPQWRTWAGTAVGRPARVAVPDSLDELARQVKAAAAEGLRVKPVGSGHSFTAIALTDGLQVRLDHLDRVLAVDAASGLVTVQAGIPLHRLNPTLASLGLAMANLGDIDRQTISGALATGTHGTGARFGGLATQVRGLELVLADGSVARCSPEERPELFAAARVGLGAFGVLTAVTLQAVPAFSLRAVEAPMRLDDVLSALPELVGGTDHFEFFWFPHTRRTLTKRNTRLPGTARLAPLSKTRAWVDDELLSNTVFEWTNRLSTRFPGLTRGVNQVAARALSARVYTDVSYRVFASPRRVVFREMEYALPREALVDALGEVDRWIERSGERISFPVEVRFAAADDVWLSTAYGRDTAYVAVHQYHRRPYERYFRGVEQILTAAGGRPHWGKLHWQDADALRARYPRFDDALRVRREVDPAGVFANAYLDRVLGPV